MGVRVNYEDEGEYVTYTMPEGWRMVDRSWRQDLPDFAMVDLDGQIRVSITGAWKGTYYNYLTLRIMDTPYDVYQCEEDEGENKEIIPTETSGAALVGKMAEAIDPQHRPAATVRAYRQSDHYTEE